MEELDALSQTCQLNVKGQITQNRESNLTINIMLEKEKSMK